MHCILQLTYVHTTIIAALAAVFFLIECACKIQHKVDWFVRTCAWIVYISSIPPNFSGYTYIYL